MSDTTSWKKIGMWRENSMQDCRASRTALSPPREATGTAQQMSLRYLSLARQNRDSCGITTRVRDTRTKRYSLNTRRNRRSIHPTRPSRCVAKWLSDGHPNRTGRGRCPTPIGRKWSNKIVRPENKTIDFLAGL